MSKEVNNKKININRELLKKFMFDCGCLFIGLIVIFCFVYFLSFEGLDLLFTILTVFVILCFLFIVSQNNVKKMLDEVIASAFEKTIDDISCAQTTNNTQKENNVISTNKIKTMQEHITNLQKFSSQMNELTDETMQKTDKSLDFTNNEYNAVKSNIEKMFSIRHKIQTIAELILELSDFVQSISATIGLVEDIAEQTNLLALNAAVEAARAGEHGKGFAVVASEIRKLADESKQATTKIISLINDIQQTANSTVLATEEGTKEIESGLELAHVISENIEQLISAMSEISKNMHEIIGSSKQISQDSNATNDYVAEISKIVENSQKITKENETIFEKLEITSNNLKQSVI